MRRTAFASLSLACGLAVALAGIEPLSASAAPIVRTTETRLTTSLGDEYDPAISGDLVVYTSNRNTNTDVFYYDLATSAEHQVTAVAGNQELTDVSGGTIVYSDLAKLDIMLYGTTTALFTDLTTDSSGLALNPAIGEEIVAWEDRRNGNLEVYAMSLASGEQRRITNETTSDFRPAIDGPRIVWEKCTGSLCDIFLYDWVDGTTRQITSTLTSAEHRPDTFGDWVVYDCSRDGDVDVFAFNLVTGVETRLNRSDVQTNANVSGNFVSFEEYDAEGLYHVGIWDLRDGESYRLTSAPGAQFLNDIDSTGPNSGRVAFTDDRNGQLEIYMTEFEVAHPDISVAQTEYNFGQVALGLSSSALFTVTNPGSAPLEISWSTDNAAFNATGSTSAQIQPGQSFDIPMTFSPLGLGMVPGTLTIATDAYGKESIEVELTGEGVSAEAPIEQEIKDLLAFYNTALSDSPPTLVGIGPGKSHANRANALRNMIEATGDLIGSERYAEAAAQLEDAYEKCDGIADQPDFVDGDARAAFAARIEALVDRLE